MSIVLYTFKEVASLYVYYMRGTSVDLSIHVTFLPDAHKNRFSFLLQYYCKFYILTSMFLLCMYQYTNDGGNRCHHSEYQLFYVVCCVPMHVEASFTPRFVLNTLI